MKRTRRNCSKIRRVLTDIKKKIVGGGRQPTRGGEQLQCVVLKKGKRDG